MAPGFLSGYFPFSSSSKDPSSEQESLSREKDAIKALPAPWYTSPEMYELERRAIFSRRWLFTTHSIRLPEPGDWLRYEIAGFEFIICKDRTGSINAFHNICRHRAFPILTAEKGHTSSVLSCKYHGWSYGLNGKLAKAPGYQDLESFDRSVNGLLPLHVHVDKNGFVWVNLDGGEKPEVKWEDDFGGIDELKRWEGINFDDYQFDHTWEMDGDYNWKILADNYNECYHCKTTHPDIPKIADLSSYDVETRGGAIIHFGNPTPEQIAKGFNVSSTYLFPNASVNVSPHFFFMQRFIPHSPTKSTMRYEVYRNKSSSDADFTVIDEIYKRIMSEDKYLCTQAQRNINAGVFVNGELHPKMERGPLYFQRLVREQVVAHWEREERGGGRQVWPAQKVMERMAGAGNGVGRRQAEGDVGFCEKIGAGCGVNKEALAF